MALADSSVVPNWRDLSRPDYIWPADGAIYYSFQTKNGTKIHLIVVDTKSDKWQLKPALNELHSSTSTCADEHRASAAVNGGYFNLSDGLSASYVVVDGKEVADPSANKALIDNAKLQPYISTILNRSEIRFLEDRAGKISIQIARHKDAIPQDLILLNSLQAGPRLLPALTSREEAFVRKDPNDGTEVDGISSMKPAARTAFGITSDGYAILVCAASAKQDPESHGLTLAELSRLLKDLGCSEAINLDGGTSTTMFIRTAASASPGAKEPPAGRLVCGHTPETFVKSVLLLEHAGKSSSLNKTDSDKLQN